MPCQWLLKEQAHFSCCIHYLSAPRVGCTCRNSVKTSTCRKVKVPPLSVLLPTFFLIRIAFSQISSSSQAGLVGRFCYRQHE